MPSVMVSIRLRCSDTCPPVGARAPSCRWDDVLSRRHGDEPQLPRRILKAQEHVAAGGAYAFDDLADILNGADRLICDLDDNIPGPDAAPRRGAGRINLDHQDAFHVAP